MHIEDCVTAIEQWGKDKGIVRAGNGAPQLEKLDEEVAELKAAFASGDREGIIDGIGDCVVVLILFARINDMYVDDCLESVYNIISKRTGKMIDGKFVKDK